MTLPLLGFIDITDRCNLNCIHCFQEQQDCVEPSADQLDNRVRAMVELGTPTVTLSGGEPFLRDDAVELIHTWISRYPGIAFDVVTNGTRLKEPLVKELEQIWRHSPKSFHISVSLDSDDTQVYSAFRRCPPDVHPATMEGIRSLTARGVPVSVSIAIGKSTIDTALSTAHTALTELGARAATMIRVFPAGAARESDEHNISDDAWASLVLAVTDIRRKMKWGPVSERVRINFFNYHELLPVLFDHGRLDDAYRVWNVSRQAVRSKLLNAANRCCQAAGQYIHVDTAGNVWPCSFAVGHYEFCLGNMEEHSLRDICSDNAVYRIFVDHKSVPPCTDCRFEDLCGGGCRIYAGTIGGSLQAPDSRCPWVEARLEREASDCRGD